MTSETFNNNMCRDISLVDIEIFFFYIYIGYILSKQMWEVYVLSLGKIKYIAMILVNTTFLKSYNVRKYLIIMYN